MKPDLLLPILKSWHESMLECDARMDELAALTGQVVDSPLGDAVYHVMGSYTKSVAERIGWDESALSDWWTSHAFGVRPMQIGLPGEKLRSISTIEELAGFIVDDLAWGEA